jgi:hypothetical protein
MRKQVWCSLPVAFAIRMPVILSAQTVKDISTGARRFLPSRAAVCKREVPRLTAAGLSG